MIPLAAIVKRLAAESYGLKVPDTAEAFGTPEAIHSLCKAAGFIDVQVYHVPPHAYQPHLHSSVLIVEMHPFFMSVCFRCVELPS